MKKKIRLVALCVTTILLLSTVFAFTASAATTKVLVYTGDNPLNNTDYTYFGTAVGKVVDHLDTIPADLSPYCCIILPGNRSGFDSETTTSLMNFVNAGGTIIAEAEYATFTSSITTMNALASALGSDLSIISDTIDSGAHVTNNIDPSPFTVNVSAVYLAASSEVNIAASSDAHSLVRSTSGAKTIMGADKIGDGWFVLVGDHNIFSDFGANGYNNYDTGVLAFNICGEIQSEPKLEATIDIEKTINGFDADEPPGPEIPYGDTYTENITVTNTGSVTLTDIVVTDDELGSIGSFGQLEPGGSGFFTVVRTVDQLGQHTNVAMVTANFTGLMVTDNDSANYFGINPAMIDIEKAINGFDADEPPGPEVTYGASFTENITVTNTGNVTLTDIVVTDSELGFIGSFGQLEPGGSGFFTIVRIADQLGQHTNVATVTANYTDLTVTDNDSANCFVVSGDINVEIDIKPGSYPNSINLNSKGVIPVAILTSESFDASNVDPETVVFGPDEASPVHYAMEDVDDDGDLDMILHFRTQEVGLMDTDTEATLNGETMDGISIQGQDSVSIVPSEGKSNPPEKPNPKANPDAPGQNKSSGENASGIAKGKADAPGQNKLPEEKATGKAKGKVDALGQNKE